MLKEIVIFAFLFAVAISAPTATVEEIHPYKFEYEIKDANYTITKQEEMDTKGVIKGTYSYLDKDGNVRTVSYVADDDGFRANVDSNEPGLISSAPAAVTYNIN